MKSLFISPHNDDETIFGAFTLLKEDPDVLTVFKSVKQEVFGIGFLERQFETEEALDILLKSGNWMQWSFPDDKPHWDIIESGFNGLGVKYRHFFAPTSYDPYGQQQHNIVGQLIEKIFPGQVTHYHTYTQLGKVETGIEIQPEPEWISLKLQAMACYRSQIREPSTQEHFLRGIKEYYSFSPQHHIGEE